MTTISQTFPVQVERAVSYGSTKNNAIALTSIAARAPPTYRRTQSEPIDAATPQPRPLLTELEVALQEIHVLQKNNLVLQKQVFNMTDCGGKEILHEPGGYVEESSQSSLSSSCSSDDSVEALTPKQSFDSTYVFSDDDTIDGDTIGSDAGIEQEGDTQQQVLQYHLQYPYHPHHPHHQQCHHRVERHQFQPHHLMHHQQQMLQHQQMCLMFQQHHFAALNSHHYHHHQQYQYPQQYQHQPYHQQHHQLNIGDRCDQCLVTNVTAYGIFIELDQHYENGLGQQRNSGLCHVSCFGTEERVEDPHTMFSINDKVTTWFEGWKNGDRMRFTMINPVEPSSHVTPPG